MYIVTVEFDVDPRFIAAFMETMLENARESKAVESGCRQFDVCLAEDDETRVFLYEVYDDRVAFEAHLATEHYNSFDARARKWVLSKRVNFYRRVSAGEARAQ